VMILDATGREVYRDPFPPALQADAASAFRFYPLLGTAFVPDSQRAQPKPEATRTAAFQDTPVAPVRPTAATTAPGPASTAPKAAAPTKDAALATGSRAKAKPVTPAKAKRTNS
jgi:hypothetical protein